MRQENLRKGPFPSLSVTLKGRPPPHCLDGSREGKASLANMEKGGEKKHVDTKKETPTLSNEASSIRYSVKSPGRSFALNKGREKKEGPVWRGQDSRKTLGKARRGKDDSRRPEHRTVAVPQRRSLLKRVPAPLFFGVGKRGEGGEKCLGNVFLGEKNAKEPPTSASANRKVRANRMR